MALENEGLKVSHRCQKYAQGNLLDNLVRDSRAALERLGARAEAYAGQQLLCLVLVLLHGQFMHLMQKGVEKGEAKRQAI